MAADGLLKTPLWGWHHTHGGRLVEFGGWSMPVQYWRSAGTASTPEWTTGPSTPP